MHSGSGRTGAGVRDGGTAPPASQGIAPAGAAPSARPAAHSARAAIGLRVEVRVGARIGRGPYGALRSPRAAGPSQRRVSGTAVSPCTTMDTTTTTSVVHTTIRASRGSRTWAPATIAA